MKKISQILTFLVITSMLLPMGWYTVSANMSGAEMTRNIAYVIHYVKPGGSGDCLSWATACDLQTALSKIPDQIWVAAGVYKPTATDDRVVSFELESGVKIFGGFPAAGGAWETRDWEANPTILSGDIGEPGNSDNSYHVVTASWVNRLGVLDGFTITGGNADSIFEPNNFGGGMYSTNSTSTLRNLNFTSNSAYWGAGIYNTSESNPTLGNVTFSSNSAARDGGGMYNDQSNPILSDVIFSANTAVVLGGGMYNTNSNPTLSNVIFSGNEGDGMYNDHSSPILTNVTFARNLGSRGGGMANYYTSNPTLTNVTFTENASIWGGGMFNLTSSPTLKNVTFSGNSVYKKSDGQGGWGGGIVNLMESSPTLTNVTFSGNIAEQGGGGMYNDDNSNPSLTHVTFYRNSSLSGGGLYNEAIMGFNGCNPKLTNTIVWENSPLADQIYNADGSSTSATYSAIEGVVVYPGEGNINADPLLGPLADNGGFTQTHAIGSGSPAIDAADPASCLDFDQRGVARPQGTGCDMGAYEYEFADGFKEVFLPLILR